MATASFTMSRSVRTGSAARPRAPYELGDSAGVSDEQAASDRPRVKHGKSGRAASVFHISGLARPARPRAPYLHHHRH